MSHASCKWKRHYDVLIERARTRKVEGYTEQHHVIPRCMGGDDSAENLVRLTPEEHYVAHQLLMKMHPNHVGLIAATVYMAGKGRRSSNRLYGWIRRRMAESQKRPVFCWDTASGKLVATYRGVKQAADAVGVHPQTIYSCIRVPGKRTAGGYSWSYTSESPGHVKTTQTGKVSVKLSNKDCEARMWWRSPVAVKEDWQRADELLTWTLEQRKSLSAFVRDGRFSSYQTCYRIVKRIKSGWNPLTDSEWKEWKSCRL